MDFAAPLDCSDAPHGISTIDASHHSYSVPDLAMHISKIHDSMQPQSADVSMDEDVTERNMWDDIGLALDADNDCSYPMDATDSHKPTGEFVENYGDTSKANPLNTGRNTRKRNTERKSHSRQGIRASFSTSDLPSSASNSADNSANNSGVNSAQHSGQNSAMHSNNGSRTDLLDISMDPTKNSAHIHGLSVMLSARKGYISADNRDQGSTDSEIPPSSECLSDDNELIMNSSEITTRAVTELASFAAAAPASSAAAAPAAKALSLPDNHPDTWDPLNRMARKISPVPLPNSKSDDDILDPHAVIDSLQKGFSCDGDIDSDDGDVMPLCNSSKSEHGFSSINAAAAAAFMVPDDGEGDSGKVHGFTAAAASSRNNSSGGDGVKGKLQSQKDQPTAEDEDGQPTAPWDAPEMSLLLSSTDNIGDNEWDLLLANDAMNLEIAVMDSNAAGSNSNNTTVLDGSTYTSAAATATATVPKVKPRPGTMRRPMVKRPLKSRLKNSINFTETGERKPVDGHSPVSTTVSEVATTPLSHFSSSSAAAKNGQPVDPSVAAAWTAAALAAQHAAIMHQQSANQQQSSDSNNRNRARSAPTSLSGTPFSGTNGAREGGADGFAGAVPPFKRSASAVGLAAIGIPKFDPGSVGNRSSGNSSGRSSGSNNSGARSARRRNNNNNNNKSSIDSAAAIEALNAMDDGHDDCASSKTSAARRNYKCGLCGKPKANHVCAVASDFSIITSQGTQANTAATPIVADVSTMTPFPGERVITVNTERTSIHQHQAFPPDNNIGRSDDTAGVDAVSVASQACTDSLAAAMNGEDFDDTSVVYYVELPDKGSSSKKLTRRSGSKDDTKSTNEHSQGNQEQHVHGGTNSRGETPATNMLFCGLLGGSGSSQGTSADAVNAKDVDSEDAAAAVEKSSTRPFDAACKIFFCM